MPTSYNSRTRIDTSVAYDSAFAYDGVSPYDATYVGTKYAKRTEITSWEYYLVDIDWDYILDIDGDFIILLGEQQYNRRTRVDLPVAYDSAFIYDWVSPYDISYVGTQYEKRTVIDSWTYYLIDTDWDYILDIDGDFIIVNGASNYTSRTSINATTWYDSAFAYNSTTPYDASYIGTQYNNRTPI